MAQQEHNQQNQNGYMASLQIEPLPAGESKDEKAYHSRFPGSTFVDRFGFRHFFNGAGYLATKSRALQHELDKIADTVGSMVYTKANPTVTPEDFQPAEDIKTQAANVVKQLQASQQPKG